MEGVKSYHDCLEPKVSAGSPLSQICTLSCRLENVFIDQAVEDRRNAPNAFGIEECVCPSDYAGISCQVRAFMKLKSIQANTKWHGTLNKCMTALFSKQSERSSPDHFLFLHRMLRRGTTASVQILTPMALTP